MTKKIIITNEKVITHCNVLAGRIVDKISPLTEIVLFGVPRGGVPIALAVFQAIGTITSLARITEDPSEATHILDDLVDSGKTKARYKEQYPSAVFMAAFHKQDPNDWFVFPWEVTDAGADVSADDIVTRLLEYTGDDATREGLEETPKRVLKAWDFWTSGYNVDIGALLKVFKDGAEGYDEMVIVKDIPIYSKCEHHMADIFGTVTIAYIPNGKIVGLSKLSRLADAFARRLQVQERLTSQIANSLVEHLEPLGVGVIIKARHMCMESRGLCQQGHHTITSALRGALKENPAARQEFMLLANS